MLTAVGIVALSASVMLTPMTDVPDPSSGRVLLAFDDVSFGIVDGSELLHGVSVIVRSDAITVLAGPSGAGKSTLLRLGNRLEVPSGGVVRYRDTDISDIDPREVRKRIGMVFQRPVPFAGTVRDNLRVAAPDAEGAALSAVLDRVGLSPEMLDRVADDLSGGEAQRMCIARTLLTDPDVLLMDEPTSALDPENRRGIEQLARDFAAQGLGVVWVTHDLDQVRRIADDVVVLVDGRNATDYESARYLADEPQEGVR
jgi:putative ABC transport system ATP-binding protein